MGLMERVFEEMKRFNESIPQRLGEVFGNPAKGEEFEDQLINAIRKGQRSIDVIFFETNYTRSGDVILIGIKFQKILPSWDDEVEAVRKKMIDYLQEEGFIITETRDSETNQRIGFSFTICLDYNAYDFQEIALKKMGA
jgi:hypothetical protein